MSDELPHANALVVGTTGLLIRGPAGSGKSSLTRALLDRADAMGAFARLVGDDRVRVSAVNHRLIARAIPAIAGLLEVRGVGIMQLAYTPAACIRLIIDLVARDQLERLPEARLRTTRIAGIAVDRIAVDIENPDPAALVLAVLCHPMTDLGAN